MADGFISKQAGYIFITPLLTPFETLKVNRSFTERRFPTKLSYGSSGGPGFRTSVFELDSGFVGGVLEWDKLRARYDVRLENATEENIAALEDHFYSMRGRAIGFRYKDWNDYKLANQNFFVGDGATTRFQIFKRYRSGTFKFDRILRKIVQGTLATINIDGVAKTYQTDFVVDWNTGIVDMKTAPASGSVGKIVFLEFDNAVRYDDDFLNIAVTDFRQLTANSVKLMEILT